ncbi:MAG: NAD-dependent epimerase/dehydratase family protein, partial [Planctomycetota bacterium]
MDRPVPRISASARSMPSMLVPVIAPRTSRVRSMRGSSPCRRARSSAGASADARPARRPSCVPGARGRCGDGATYTRGMPRSLVTGCAGFVGSHLCDSLRASGHSVVCLD